VSGSPASGLQSAIRGHVFQPHDGGFAATAHVFNTRFDSVRPQAVARPVDELDVRDAVRFTVAHDVRVRVRSGGHSYAGYSTLTDGIVLDLRRLNSVTFDKPSGLVTVGAGAQLIDVYAGLASHGVTVPGGSCRFWPSRSSSPTATGRPSRPVTPSTPDPAGPSLVRPSMRNLTTWPRP
jgi:FAD/FMN-containing dehydrogenase